MTKPQPRRASPNAANELDEATLDGAIGGGTAGSLVGIDIRPASGGGVFVAAGDINGDGRVDGVDLAVSKPRT